MFILQIFGSSGFFRDMPFPIPIPPRPPAQPVVQQPLQQPLQQTNNTNAYFTVVNALRPTVNFIFGSRPSHRQGLPLR